MKRLILLILIMTAAACGSKQSLQSGNLAYLYDPQKLALRPYFQVEHLSDSISRIYYRVESDDLLYKRDSEAQPAAYKAVFGISYALTPLRQTQQVLDSNYFELIDLNQSPGGKTITGHFDLKTPDLGQDKDQRYLLFVRMSDLGRGANFSRFVDLNKSSIRSADHFQAFTPDSQRLFTNHVPAEVPFVLKHSQLQPKYFYVRYYQREFPLALPPYSSEKQYSFELKPDSIYRVAADEAISLPKHGFYLFGIDTASYEGFTMFSFYPSFPLVGEFRQMAEPLRYLTTQNEYAELQARIENKEELRAWINKFWLARSGSKERSRTMIASFYQRVEEANRYFSSYHEGWKTDRGILYVIYGPPTKVYRTQNGEVWVYGNESSSLSYTFNFSKVANPFSNNDYELERLAQYRYGWGQAVDAWRNGHIYDSKDIKREQDEQDQLQFRNQNPYWY